MRTPISFITVFAMTLLGSVFLGIANAASQDIGLVPGWNIVSTSRVVANHAFSATEDFSNFDIYLVNAASVAGWSTMAEVGQSEFTPLYGYFINNKTNMTQILTLNFKDDTTPNERLFERKFTKTGWYSIGVANPTYAVVQNAATADTNNVTSILDSLNGNHSTVIDFTDSDFNTSPSSVRVGDTWKAAVPNDLNSLNDFRETKGYAVYITKEEALYSGFQNTDFQPVILSISPTSVIAGTGEFVLTVNGYNFTPSSTLRWDGADKETTYVSSTQISALILASDVAASTTVKISIFNPAPSGGTSGEFNFTINPTPQLDIALASTPTSTNFVKGATEVGFLGITLRAVNHDIKINSIKVSASTVVGTADELKSDVLNLKLFDGDTQIGATGSLTGTEIPSAIFSSLDYTISSGASKTLIVKADLSSIATTNNKYALKVADVADVSGVDIVAVDPNGNEPTYTGFDEISGPVITVLNAGSMSVATAPDDVDSKAGIVVTDGGATQQVLSKFRFTAANEALTVKKLKLLVNNDSSTAAAATSTAEVTRVYLYDGGSQIGSTTGYSVIGSGAAAGDVVIEDLNWLVAKDATKTLTVKGTVNTIANGAATGRSVYVHVKNSKASGDGFEAVGSATTTYDAGAAGGAKGNQKVAYKTYPAITTASAGTLLTSGSNDLLLFTVTNKSSNEQVSWSVLSFNVSGAAATVPEFGANTADFVIRNLTNSVNLTIGTTATAGTSTAGQYIVYLSTEETIPAGGSRNYQLSGTVTAPGSNSSISTQLVLRADATTASILKGAAWRDVVTSVADSTTGVNTVVNDTDSGFVWSDNSATGHTYGGEGAAGGTADYANGVFIDTFPSTTYARSN